MNCPACHTDLGIHIDTGQGNRGHVSRGPQAGDYSMCSECFTPLQFQRGGTCQAVTWEELPEPCQRALNRFKRAFIMSRGGGSAVN